MAKNVKNSKTNEMRIVLTDVFEQYEDPRASIVRQLKEARIEQGMTQAYLAELVGTKKSNISRLESGRYNPSLDFLLKIANGLGKQLQLQVK